MPETSTEPEAHITVQKLDMAYGSFVIQRDLNFAIRHGDIFIIMGGSGCGKSTLLKHLVGLKAPARGTVLFGEQDLWLASPEEQERMMRRERPSRLADQMRHRDLVLATRFGERVHDVVRVFLKRVVDARLRR